MLSRLVPIAVVLAAGCSRSPTAVARNHRTGQLDAIRLAADFGGADLDGKPLRLGDFRGKVVLVDFWATACVPCVKQLPSVEAAYAKYHGRGFEVLGVTIDGDAATVRDFAAKRPMPWRHVLDTRGELTNAVVPDGHGIPMTVLVGRDGVAVAADVADEELGPLIERELAR